jgi:hypothetical protein
MEVRDRRGYLRPAVLVAILLLHGSLILVLLRAKPAYKARPASALLSSFFIDPERRLTTQTAAYEITTFAVLNGIQNIGHQDTGYNIRALGRCGAKWIPLLII